jgi:hypothetical protein
MRPAAVNRHAWGNIFGAFSSRKWKLCRGAITRAKGCASFGTWPESLARLIPDGDLLSLDGPRTPLHFAEVIKVSPAEQY